MLDPLASRTAAWLKAISGSSGDKDEAILRRNCEQALKNLKEVWNINLLQMMQSEIWTGH